MMHKRQKYILIMGIVGIVAVIIGSVVYYAIAGNLNSPGAPAPTMYTLEQIYHCLAQGEGYCVGISSEGEHSLEPSSAHRSTMYDLTQIWQAIPWHNPGTATSGDVCNASTFYTNSATKLTGSRTNCGNWTPQGTATVDKVRCGVTFYSSDTTIKTGTWCPSGQTCNESEGVCQ